MKRRRGAPSLASRRGPAPLRLAALVTLLLTLPGNQAGSEERARPAVKDPEVDLDKLYTVREGSFPRIASRLMSLTGARARDKTYSYVRFELFEGEWVPPPPDLGTDCGKWVFKSRGQAQVIGNGRMWTPRVGDVQQNIKELSVTVPPGKPRSLLFRFRVHASQEKGQGPNKTVTVLGREEIEFQLLQHPGDKSLRLVLDPLTFRKHQESLDSNWVEEEDEGAKEGKNGEKKTEGPQGEEGPSAPEPDARQSARSEVTLVRSFKADEREIVVGFRRKWSGLGNKVVDGTLHINMNPSLSTTLFYNVPTKSGKTGRVLAAYFKRGHRIQ